MKPLGILGAMEEEIGALLRELRGRRTVRSGKRAYHRGKLFGRDCVIVFSRWGKVAAATTATHLISEYGVGEILFTGVAGGVRPGLRVGDIVIGTRLVQHDLDARPLFPRHEVPLLGVSAIPAGTGRSAALAKAARKFVAAGLPGVSAAARDEFGLVEPHVHEGEIASGDRFFGDSAAVAELRARLPDALCVEMEGAAVAQVCYEHGIPFSIVRTISDSADENAHVDFPRFIREVARAYSVGIMKELLANRK